MKKGIIIAGIVVLVAIGLIWGNMTGKSTQNYSCTDSDDGDDIYTKGTVIYSEDGGKTVSTRVDECGAGGVAQVREHTCSEYDKMEEEWKSCGDGECVDGACVAVGG